MSILIRGSSRCPFCGDVIAADDEAMLFPVFVANELDSAWAFDDIAAHSKCVFEHPLGRHATKLLNEYEDAMQSRTRRCEVCGEVIVNPDDYLMIVRLGDVDDPLHGLSFTELHTSHLSRWPYASSVLTELEGRRQAGTWAGRAVDKLISIVRREMGGVG
jgi:hypothetical protein